MNVRVIFFNELRFLRVLIISTFLKKSFFFYSASPNVEFTFNFQSKFRNGIRVLNIRFHNRIIINTSVIREIVILMPVRIQRNSKKKKKKTLPLLNETLDASCGERFRCGSKGATFLALFHN